MNKKQDAIYTVGEHELLAPDYQFISILAEDIKISALEVLDLLFKQQKGCPKGWETKIESRRFTSLSIDRDVLPLSGLPQVGELAVKSLKIGSSDYCSDLNLSSFKNLEALDCSCNKIESLDLSFTPNLVFLNCTANFLCELDLSPARKIKRLYCDSNNFRNLDLAHVPDLLSLRYDRPKHVDLSRVPNLLNIDFSNDSKQLSQMLGFDLMDELDLASVPDLKVLDFSENNITNIDLSRVPKLTRLRCRNNNIRELNLFFVPDLECLICDGNNMNQVDIRPLRSLQQLFYSSGKTVLVKRQDQNFE